MVRWKRCFLIGTVITILGISTNAWARPICCCNHNMNLEQRAVLDWRLTGNAKRCNHGFDGFDAERVYEVQWIYHCEECDTDITLSQIRFQWVCRGYSD